ncbi:hypothetical protein CJF30_00009787 [Rutstroemia sp. NJR-2017a BBW]|nr:hypothetical protein CJF30_00009787 [Rutstroemia sp. NJR-2017a BBW]
MLSYSTTNDDRRLPYQLPNNGHLNPGYPSNSSSTSRSRSPVGHLSRKPSFGPSRQTAPPPQNESNDTSLEQYKWPERSKRELESVEPVDNFKHRRGTYAQSFQFEFATEFRSWERCWTISAQKTTEESTSSTTKAICSAYRCPFLCIPSTNYYSSKFTATAIQPTSPFTLVKRADTIDGGATVCRCTCNCSGLFW